MLYQVVVDGVISESYAMPDHNDDHHLVTAGDRKEITSTAVDITLDKTYYTVLVDAVGANRTITLPAAASHEHRVYNIKKIDASANTVTIDGNGVETIDGAATVVISVQWDSYTLQCDSTGWFII